jgi:hypothetical protein
VNEELKRNVVGLALLALVKAEIPEAKSLHRELINRKM